MSKKMNKIKILLLFAAAAGCGVVYYGMNEQEPIAEIKVAYKEETVHKGSVATGITESGSVTYGTEEQEFSIVEIVEVDESSTYTSDSASVGDSMSGNMGGNLSVTMPEGMNDASSSQSASKSSDSGMTTSLEVDEVYVAVGQVVKEGDALLKITEDSIAEYRSEMETAVETAKLNVEQETINVESKRAEAEYTYNMYLAQGKTAEATYEATITSLENKVTELEEELQESADTLEEYQEELDAGYDVEDELEKEQLNYETIEADLEVARNNLTTQSIEAKQTYENAMTNYKYADKLYEIDTNGLEDDLNDAKDVLKEAEEALKQFEEQIGDGMVYAACSGTIQNVAYAAGDTLTNDSTVVTFADAENVTMTAAVSQSDISQISVGDQVSVSLTAYDDENFEAEVISISTTSTVGSSTVNYDVEVRFTGDTDKVYSGMTGEVTFVDKKVTDVLYISNKAIHQDGARSFVKVKNTAGEISEVDVETGFSNGTVVEIVNGLEEGQIVLIESQVSE